MRLTTPSRRASTLPRPLARPPRALPCPGESWWRVGSVGLLLMWLLALLLGPELLDAMGLQLNSHGHAQLYPHGHPFVDARAWLGVPNALDVLTNAPLALAGAWGLWRMRASRWPVETRRAARVFFGGLLLTGFGSAWYHWAPDSAGLVVDRLGMAVTFAGALGLAVAERVGAGPARQTLWVTLVLALVSAVLPHTHGHVLPWAVVQFGGVALMIGMALRRPVAGAVGLRIGALIAWYALAKLLEMGDEAVYLATREAVSGHSLKHIAAALAAWPVLAASVPGALRQNAAGSGAARAQ